jgi:Tfp pilus assembly PilM family ATPase
MDPTTFFWIIGAVISLQMAVVGAIAAALWVHASHCKVIAAAVARIEATVERVCVDIGTHDTGLRGAVHETSNRVTEHGMRIAMLERQENLR